MRSKGRSDTDGNYSNADVDPNTEQCPKNRLGDSVAVDEVVTLGEVALHHFNGSWGQFIACIFVYITESGRAWQGTGARAIVGQPSLPTFSVIFGYYLSISLLDEQSGAGHIHNPKVVSERPDKDVQMRGSGKCGMTGERGYGMRRLRKTSERLHER